MLQAMLHGKLTRQEEQMEDLLTSNVLGLLKYMPPEMVLIPFLSQAKNPLSGMTLHEWLKDTVGIKLWKFWPRISAYDSKPCEPDVEIIFRNRDETLTWLLIEAKYSSGKSSLEIKGEYSPNDQLAREFDNLRTICEEEGVVKYGVIYLTADFCCPIEDLQESSREYEEKRQTKPHLFWLSWRGLYEFLISEGARDAPISSDLQQLLLYLELVRYRKLRFEELNTIGWTFSPSAHSWSWEKTIARACLWFFVKGQIGWPWKVKIPSKFKFIGRDRTRERGGL
jgi:hypothetical protein